MEAGERRWEEMERVLERGRDRKDKEYNGRGGRRRGEWV